MGRRPRRADYRCRRADLPAGRAAHRLRRRRARPLSRRRTPDRLPGLVDSHCHLQHAAFDHDREDVIDRAQAAGLARIMVPGWDLPSSEAAIELAVRHPQLIDAAVGIHPHHAAETDVATWRRIEELAGEPTTVAVGEIGLDFYRNLSPPDVQRAALERQLDLARRVAKPVLVHDRDAHDAIGQLLTAWAGPPGRSQKGVLHAFSGDAELAARLAAAGYLISFALPLTFGSAHGPRSAAATLTAETLLVETDAPYLGPGPQRRNEPTTALRVTAELARLRDADVEEMANTVGANYERLAGRAPVHSPDIGLA